MANLASLVTGQITANGTAVQLLPAGARTITGVLVNTSAAVFLGGSTVTASGTTGGLLVNASQQPVFIPAENLDELWAITTGGNATVSFAVI